MKATAIFGPPGTGKTTTMMRLVSECVERGYKPEEIMYLSFTKAAAGEVLKRMGLRRSDTVSTIHSACYRLLSLGGASVVNFRKLHEFGRIVGVPFKGNNDDIGETMEVGDMYLQIQSLALNRAKSFEQEYMDSDRPGSPDEFHYFVNSYRDWKAANGLIDFTDMLLKYIESPREHGCKVIFVDESQDLSTLQWNVIHDMVRMAGVELVYFAGDDDQAIFEWAGADPHGMVSFRDEYAGDQMVLDQSYRLPVEVHRVVTAIGDRIGNRVEKRYLPRDAHGKFDVTLMFEPMLQKEGFIIARSHMVKQAAERMMIERRIAFMSEGGGLPGPFSCKAVKAIRAWKRYKDSGNLAKIDLDAMMSAAIDRVRGDLIAGDLLSVLNEDPMRIFKLPPIFVDYFKDVDVYSEPKLTTMTIHGSKGREADEVTLITDWPPRVEAGFVLNPDSEHRTWYVGASRAKQLLRITSMGGDGYGI